MAFLSKFATMQVTAQQLCDLLQGTLEGDPEVSVSAPSKIEEGRPGTISFLGNPKYESYAYTTASSILLVSRDFQPAEPIKSTLIRVDDVYASVAILLDQFGQSQEQEAGVHADAFVDESAEVHTTATVARFAIIEKGAKIGAGTIIYPQVYIGENVTIGENCILFPGVKVYRDCVLGDHCILHSNVVLGSDGFGFAPQADGTFKKVPQLGNVLVENNVEIGANTVIDRATMGSTIIRAGAKLDNLIQIAHNVEIGHNTVMAAQSGVAGSTKVGKNCLIGGQAGLVGHIQLADGTKVQAQSGINKPIKKPGTAVYGSPALAYNDYLRSYAVFRRLPALQQELTELRKKLAELEKKS